MGEPGGFGTDFGVVEIFILLDNGSALDHTAEASLGLESGVSRRLSETAGAGARVFGVRVFRGYGCFAGTGVFSRERCAVSGAGVSGCGVESGWHFLGSLVVLRGDAWRDIVCSVSVDVALVSAGPARGFQGLVTFPGRAVRIGVIAVSAERNARYWIATRMRLE